MGLQNSSLPLSTKLRTPTFGKGTSESVEGPHCEILVEPK